MALSQAEQSWLDARFPDLTGEQQLRLRRQRRWATLGGTLGGGLLLGVVLILLFPPQGAGEDASGVREVAGIVVLSAGAILELAAFVRGLRSGKVSANWNSPLWSLSMRDRRLVLRQLRGQRPLVSQDVVIVRATAARLADQRWNVGVITGLLLLQAGQALMHTGRLGWVLVLGFLAVGLALADLVRNMLAADRFLLEHPAED